MSGRVQTLTISNWHPLTSANRSHDHWRKIQRAHHIDRDMAWASAMQAGWKAIPGKVRLTIVLVYPRTYRIDTDNLHTKCKGLIDGLKSDYRNNHGRLGWFADDSTEWLELIVRVEVEKGKKETRLTLEPSPQVGALAYDRIFGTEADRDMAGERSGVRDSSSGRRFGVA